MAEQPDRIEEGEGRPGDLRKKVMGGAALVLGATGLFLFIVGLKRRHRLDEEREVSLPPEGSHRWTDATARHLLEDEEEEEALQAADRQPAPTRRRAPRRRKNGGAGSGEEARPRRAPRRRTDAARRRSLDTDEETE